MAKRSTPKVSARKQPKQARANELVTAVLDAAIQVLRKEGAARFTTARVAERAGVSVGSLYQYFPNKAAILFRLQSDEWRRTCDLLREILEDRGASPHKRLRKLVHAFLESECEEAQVRLALGDAAPFYRDAPEAAEARRNGSNIVFAFIVETLPLAGTSTHRLVANLIEETLSQVGSSFSGTDRTSAEIATYADGMADMFCAYLDKLKRRDR